MVDTAAAIDAQLRELAASDEACRRLMRIPGVGPLVAGILRALAGDVTRFRSGRDVAAWLGLTPRQKSSGDKGRHGAMSTAGNRELWTSVLNNMPIRRVPGSRALSQSESGSATQ